MSKALIGSKALTVSERCVRIVKELVSGKVIFITYSKQRCEDREGLFTPITSELLCVSSKKAIMQAPGRVLGISALPSRV